MDELLTNEQIDEIERVYCDQWHLPTVRLKRLCAQAKRANAGEWDDTILSIGVFAAEHCDFSGLTRYEPSIERMRAAVKAMRAVPPGDEKE